MFFLYLLKVFILGTFLIIIGMVSGQEESACGSSSIAFSTYVAGVVAGKHLIGFEECCSAHDNCYDDCISREECDKQFGVCMRHTCAWRNIEDIDLEECMNTSSLFETAVQTFGGIAYYENCTTDSITSSQLIYEFSSDTASSVKLMYDFLEVSSAELMEMLSGA